MSNVDGFTLPKPGIPKTLGILNVIFGVLMVLYGMCTLGFMIAMPALTEFAKSSVNQAQAKIEDRQKAQIKELEEREVAATSEEEKSAIKAEKEELIANPQVMPKIETTGMEVLQEPVVKAYSYTQLVSGMILSLILMISGIGLIRLKPGGRTLALSWAVLQIIQIVLLSAVSFFYVQPITVASTEKMFAKMEADASGPNAAPGAAENLKLVKAMQGSGATNVFLILFVVSGCIYPTIVLILLNNPGARAALLGPKPDEQGEF
ncbi:hypothetical protein P12x_004302 [Tundrisphaera lichenicola]|uniref:hypothetical protein n=1 Tax=Tundrisphaera lichenicola TaxID=2029860 RepID=UPI003EBA66E4